MIEGDRVIIVSGEEEGLTGDVVGVEEWGYFVQLDDGEEMYFDYSEVAPEDP